MTHMLLTHVSLTCRWDNDDIYLILRYFNILIEIFNRNRSSGAWLLGWRVDRKRRRAATCWPRVASYPTGPWSQRLSRAFLRQVPRPTLASSIWLVASRRPSPGKGNCRFEPLVTSSHLSREPEKLKKLQWPCLFLYIAEMLGFQDLQEQHCY